MMLKIDHEIYLKSFGEWLFDPDTYAFYEKSSADEVLLKECLEFVHIEDIEIMREFVPSLNMRSISNRFIGLDDMQFIEMFWRNFDDDGTKINRYRSFEAMYRINKIKEWCRKNGVACYVCEKI